VGEYGALKLLDEDKTVLDSEFRARPGELNVGDEIEFTGFLCTVEELCVDQQDDKRSSPEHNKNGSLNTAKHLQCIQTEVSAPFKAQSLNRAPSVGLGRGKSLLGRNVLGGNVFKQTMTSSLHPNKPQQSGPATPTSAEQEPRFTPSYFKKVKYNKLFGEEVEDDKDCVVPSRASNSVCMRNESGRNQQRTAFDVLALMGLSNDAQELSHQQPLELPLEAAWCKVSGSSSAKSASFASRYVYGGCRLCSKFGLPTCHHPQDSLTNVGPWYSSHAYSACVE
jgi:hypothetical protein